MADLVAARSAFQRIKFTQEAATKLVDKEFLDSIDELKELDQKRCDRIVSRLIKPGGAGVGLEVSERATTNLAIAAHLCKMWVRCQRAKTMANIDLGDGFETAKRQMIMEEKHVNDMSAFVPVSNKQLNDRNFIEFGEELIKKINKVRHVTGICVGSVLRVALVPPASADDPPNSYMTHDDEACARVEIVRPAHNHEPADQLELSKNTKWNQVAIECNGDCYDLLYKMLGETRYWAHVDNKMQRDRDGRAAFLSIRKNVCGPTANADLNRTNRARADAAYWDGEKRNRN